MPNAYGQIAFTPTVIDVQTIGYADYRENRQFISLGNLHRNNRISIIAVDFAHQKRLKLLGRVETTEDPDVVTLLQGDSTTNAEPGIINIIEAFDWNCPNHIPIRLTDRERDNKVARRHSRTTTLENQLSEKTPPGKGACVEE